MLEPSSRSHMTRFDAPVSDRSASGSAVRAAGILVRDRFGIVLAALTLTVVALVAPTALICGAIAVPAAFRQAFVASPVLVFMAPNASRGDVDALEAKLTALPDVATASLRRKEDALAALIAGGFPGPTDGRNPLPDVWAVTLHGAGPSFTTEANAARDVIGALPSVDQVRFDEGWAGALDRVSDRWVRSGAQWVAGLLAGIAVMLFCVHLLFGRALAIPIIGGESGTSWAPLFVGIALSAVSATIAYGLCALSTDPLLALGLPDLKPIGVFTGPSLVRSIAAVAGVGTVVICLGVAAGLATRPADRNDRQIKSL